MSTTKKTKETGAKQPAPEKNGKIEMVNIFSTTYGYYRYWIREILAEGGISKFRFVKDADSYNGKIAVAKSDIDKAKKVLGDYQKKNPDTVAMWQ
jgi:hypothetical protein